MKQLTLIILSILFVQTGLMAQCDGGKYESELLKELEQGYKRKALIALDGNETSKVEHEIELEEGLLYQVSLKNTKAGMQGLFVTIYDAKGRKKACSLFNDKFYSTITYSCRATGTYRFVFEFRDIENLCGAALLSSKGTKRKKKD